MGKIGLNITSKEFKQECYNLAPIIKHLRNDADNLSTFFINHEKEIENLNAV